MEEGFIIHISHSNVVKIFSKNYGIVVAFANKKNNKIEKYKWQVGTLVNFSLLEKNNYKVFDIDVEKYFLDILFDNRLFMAIFNSSINLLNNILLKNEGVDDIYKIFYNLMFSYDNKNIVLNYIDFLFSIMYYCGYSINLNSSIISGNQDVFYISPKTGNCITKEEGEKFYKNILDKLFVIPRCFLEFNQDKNELINSIEILHYFIIKYCYDNNIYAKNIIFFKNEIIKIIKSIQIFT